MIYCKRCSLSYIRGNKPIEAVKEAKTWVPAENNEMWMVCEECAKAVMYANRFTYFINDEKKLEAKKRRYEETKELI